MLHHKHFDCNYGAMHVPLDYFFGTYAGSKEEVESEETFTKKIKILIRRFLTFGEENLLEKKPMTLLSMKQVLKQGKSIDIKGSRYCTAKHLQF